MVSGPEKNKGGRPKKTEVPELKQSIQKITRHLVSLDEQAMEVIHRCLLSFDDDVAFRAAKYIVDKITPQRIEIANAEGETFKTELVNVAQLTNDEIDARIAECLKKPKR